MKKLVITLFALMTLGLSYGQETATIRIVEMGKKSSYLRIVYSTGESETINLEAKSSAVNEKGVEKDLKINKALAKVLIKGYKIKTSTSIVPHTPDPSNSIGISNWYNEKMIFLVKED